MTTPSALDHRPEWLAPLSDARNETILSAAFDMFVEKGLNGATMLDIATRARVSKETLYNRFDSKEGLFYALLAWGARRLPQAEDALGAGAIADPVAALYAYGRECLRLMLKPEAIAMYRVVLGVADQMPEVARVYDDFTCGAGAAITTRLAQALDAAGVCRIADIDEFNDAFIGLLRANLHHKLALGLAPQPDDATTDAWADIAISRLLAAYAPARIPGPVKGR
ncbi:MAG: TetR/AcrR family transcriptional regulator [Alphaproteobacteria bacterium]|nr:TetR/AcrR family transcriptional regulator [Alphaproteobacteria bacterium]